MAGQNQMTIRRAAFINMGSRYTAALLQLAYSIILARLLTPDAFGIVAIAEVFVVFFNLFADMGLGSAVIQRQDLEDSDISRLFGFSIALAIVLCLLFASLSLPLSLLYEREELLVICPLLSSSVFLATLNTVPNALLMKQERFIAAGARQIFSVVVGGIIGISSALLGAGYLAIVAYSVTSSLIVFMWNWLTNRIHPLFQNMITSVRKVFSYSAWLFSFNLITYFSRNVDNLISGYAFGAADLGNYSKAYQLTHLPQTYLTNIVTSVMHPILAKRQNEIDYIYTVFIKTVKILSLLGVLLSAIFLFCPKEVIHVLYGSQWEVAVPCLQLLSLSIWAQMVSGTSGAMFQVLNKTRLQFIRGVVIALVVVGGAILGALAGSIEAMALCEGIAYNVAFVTLCPFLIKLAFKKRISAFLRHLLPDAGIFVCLCASLALLNSIDFGNVYLALAVKAAIAVALWLGLLVIFRQAKWLSLILPSKLRKGMPSWIMR